MKYRKILNTLFNPNLSPPSPVRPKNGETYVIVDGKQAGPFSNFELQVLIKKGILAETTMVWSPGYTNWTQAQYVPHVNKLLLLGSPNKGVIAKAKEEGSERHPIFNDLVAAMIQLGYSKKDAYPIADDILKKHPQASLSEAIKIALKDFH